MRGIARHEIYKLVFSLSLLGPFPARRHLDLHPARMDRPRRELALGACLCPSPAYGERDSTSRSGTVCGRSLQRGEQPAGAYFGGCLYHRDATS